LLFIKSVCVCLPIGRGESIRLILADNGAKWTEDVIQLSDWFAGKCPLKKEAVFGQLPQFSDGDFVLYQSNAILRYLGRKFVTMVTGIENESESLTQNSDNNKKKVLSLAYFILRHIRVAITLAFSFQTQYSIAGSNNHEVAIIDMTNDGVEDLRLKYCRLMFSGFETVKEKYEKDLPNELSAFERILSKNSNGTKFLVGDKISYADYNLLDVLHCHLNIFPDCLSAFPLLTAFKDRISSQSNLSEYLNSEDCKNRPFFPKQG
ncbi:hypothetical protein AB205_0215930, partial [Aquarana catesbeiana]